MSPPKSAPEEEEKSVSGEAEGKASGLVGVGGRDWPG